MHGATLQIEAVEHLCASISRRGHGLIGPSTYLSPYQVLLIGQYDTLNMLEQEMDQYLPAGVTLRRRPNHWPPLHTPLVWERNIPNRTAMAMHHIGGGERKPTPSIVSCATGSASYDEWNSRAILADWTDHPQRLWDVMENSLASGAEIVIHVGPEPKLFPTGFERLSHRIMKQLKMKHLDRLGSTVIPSISRNGWLIPSTPCKCCAVAGAVPEPYHSGGLAARAGGLLTQTETRGSPMETQLKEPERETFVETALKMGGKSEEEARTTGTVDRADDEVDALFAARYQTANSPVHRAVWDRKLPVELFMPEQPAVPARMPADDAKIDRGRHPPPRPGNTLRSRQQGVAGTSG